MTQTAILYRTILDATGEIYYATILTNEKELYDYLGNDASKKEHRYCECGNALRRSQQVCDGCKQVETAVLRFCETCGSEVGAKRRFCNECIEQRRRAYQPVYQARRRKERKG